MKKIAFITFPYFACIVWAGEPDGNCRAGTYECDVFQYTLRQSGRQSEQLAVP